MPQQHSLTRVAGATGRVLVVDDEPELRAALRRILGAAGYEVLEARSIAEASGILDELPVDVVVLDLGLPDGSGLELLKVAKQAWPTTAVLVLTASNAIEDMRAALRLGASAYLHKPADALTLQAQVREVLTRSRAYAAASKLGRFGGRSQAEANGGTPPSDFTTSFDHLPVHLASQLTRAWDLRHVETGAHVRRVEESTRILARALGTSDAEAARLGQVAMLHDIGKIAIPDAILTKPGKLTQEELAIMQRHAEIGGDMLSGSGHPFLDLAATVARNHHERWNGSGYPDGLVGDACPWQARLVGVVDVYDALGHARCYKEAWTRGQLIDFFEAKTGSMFDPHMAEALLSHIERLELVKSQYPDPVRLDFASGSRIKLAVASPAVPAQGSKA